MDFDEISTSSVESLSRAAYRFESWRSLRPSSNSDGPLGDRTLPPPVSALLRETRILQGSPKAKEGQAKWEASGLNGENAWQRSVMSQQRTGPESGDCG